MISVIIPVYNAEKTLGKTLESVKNQEGDFQFEIIIINDGSTDFSSQIAHQFAAENPELNIIVLNQENKGVSAARNAGLQQAKGEYIALLDADDIWLPTKTKTQISFLEDASSAIDFISCRINQNKILFPYFPKNGLAKVTFRKLLIRNGIPTPTVLFKKKVLENTGYFDENQRYAEDHNYWLHVSLHHNMYIVDQSLVVAGGGKRTFGVSGLSANLKEMKKGFQKNISEMYFLKKIHFHEYVFLRILYFFKYFLLIIRTRY